jgi:hypothetical protein
MEPLPNGKLKIKALTPVASSKKLPIHPKVLEQASKLNKFPVKCDYKNRVHRCVASKDLQFSSMQ